MIKKKNIVHVSITKIVCQNKIKKKNKSYEMRFFAMYIAHQFHIHIRREADLDIVKLYDIYKNHALIMKCIHQYQPIKFMHLKVIFYITLRPTQACLTQNDATISRNMYNGPLS